MASLNGLLLLASAVLLVGLLLNRWWSQRGLPILILFLLIGGILGIIFNISLTEQTVDLIEPIASVFFIFIMFYGGFSINWLMGRTMVKTATLLASMGVFLTFGALALFNIYVLKLPVIIALLTAAVLSPTDATSVFYILKFHNLSLSKGAAPTLEMESGSNDPFGYMVLAIIIQWYQGTVSGAGIAGMLIVQVGIALLIGFIASKIFDFLLNTEFTGFDNAEILILFALVVVSYSATEMFGGNGYLGVFIMGLIIGSENFHNKYEVIHFFEGLTDLMQLVLFTLIGLVVSWQPLVQNLLPAIGIFVVLTLVIRPAAMWILLHNNPVLTRAAKIVVAWAGLRGASALILTMISMSQIGFLSQDFFHIVFIITFLSLLVQGSMLPVVATKAGGIDEKENLITTFADFRESLDVQIIEIDITPSHEWANTYVKDTQLLSDLLILLITHNDKTEVARGDVLIQPGDKVYLAAPPLITDQEIHLQTIYIHRHHPWIDQEIGQVVSMKDRMILALVRDEHYIIPNGRTQIKERDRLIVYIPIRS
ncbi:potassium/proton antiporter [Dolosicoccus paucivorans]